MPNLLFEASLYGSYGYVGFVFSIWAHYDIMIYKVKRYLGESATWRYEKLTKSMNKACRFGKFQGFYDINFFINAITVSLIYW